MCLQEPGVKLTGVPQEGALGWRAGGDSGCPVCWHGGAGPGESTPGSTQPAQPAPGECLGGVNTGLCRAGCQHGG